MDSSSSRRPSPLTIPSPTPTPGETTLFSGDGDMEVVETFLQSVHRAAAVEGRIHDDLWIRQYVQSHLLDSALVWFQNELDEDVRKSWKTLRQAFLVQYSRAHSPQLTHTVSSKRVAALYLPILDREVEVHTPHEPSVTVAQWVDDVTAADPRWYSPKDLLSGSPKPPTEAQGSSSPVWVFVDKIFRLAVSPISAL